MATKKVPSTNTCVDHPGAAPPRSQVTAQLVVTTDTREDGPLVRGTQSVDGNLPSIPSSAVAVQACIDFAPDTNDSRERFRELLEAYTW